MTNTSRRGHSPQSRLRGFRRLVLIALCSGLLVPSVDTSATEPKLLIGHTDPTYHAVYTPDGQRIVTGAFDKSLRLWDRSSLKSIRKMTGHTGLVLSLALDPAGQRVASSSVDQTVRVWELPQNSPLTTVTMSGPALVDTSRDGQLAVVVSQDGIARLIKTADQSVIREITGLPTPIDRLALRSDQVQFAVSQPRGDVRVYRLGDGVLEGEFSGGPGPLTALAFSYSNQHLLTAGIDGVIRRWPTVLPQGWELATEHGAIPRLAASPDQAVVVTAHADHTLHVWHRDQGQWQRALPVPAVPIRCLAFAESNGALLAVGTEDQIPRVVNVQTGELVREYPRHEHPITAISLDQGLAEITVGDAGGVVTVYRTADGSVLRQLPTHGGGVVAVRYFPEGDRLATTGMDRVVRILQVSDGAELRRFELPATPTALAVGYGGERIAVGTDDGQIRLFAPSADGAGPILAGHVGRITSLDFSRDRQRLVSSADDGSARVWLLATGQEEQCQWAIGGPAVAVASADQQAIYVGAASGRLQRRPLLQPGLWRADQTTVQQLVPHLNGAWHAIAGADGSVRLLDNGNGQLVRSFPGLAGPAKVVALNPNQQQIAAADANRLLIVWNINDAKPQYQITLPAEPVQLAFNPEGKKLLVATSDHLLRVYSAEPLNPQPNPAPNQEPAQILDGHTGTITSLGWGADNKLAYSGSNDGTVKAWSIASVGPVMQLNGHQGPVYGVAWSPTAPLLASVSQDKTLKFWDVTNQQNVRTSPPQGLGIYHVVFTRDGQFVLTAGADRSVRRYRVDDAVEVQSYQGATDAVYSVTVNAQQSLVAAAGMDRKVHLWPFNANATLKSLAGHKDDIYRVQFNPAGNRLVSLGYSGQLFVWDPDRDQPLWSTRLSGISFSVEYSPDGKQLAICGNDSRVQLIDLPAEAQ